MMKSKEHFFIHCKNKILPSNSGLVLSENILLRLKEHNRILEGYKEDK